MQITLLNKKSKHADPHCSLLLLLVLVSAAPSFLSRYYADGGFLYRARIVSVVSSPRSIPCIKPGGTKGGAHVSQSPSIITRFGCVVDKQRERRCAVVDLNSPQEFRVRVTLICCHDFKPSYLNEGTMHYFHS